MTTPPAQVSEGTEREAPGSVGTRSLGTGSTAGSRVLAERQGWAPRSPARAQAGHQALAAAPYSPGCPSQPDDGIRLHLRRLGTLTTSLPWDLGTAAGTHREPLFQESLRGASVQRCMNQLQRAVKQTLLLPSKSQISTLVTYGPGGSLHLPYHSGTQCVPYKPFSYFPRVHLCIYENINILNTFFYLL